MKVLLDHCVPQPFARHLVGHAVRTTKDMGWAKFANGVLLARAAAEFDAFVTVDKGMMHEQDSASQPLPVVVVRAIDNTIDELAPAASQVCDLLGQSLQRRVYVIDVRPNR